MARSKRKNGKIFVADSDLKADNEGFRAFLAGLKERKWDLY
jgi:hypothetical protein